MRGVRGLLAQDKTEQQWFNSCVQQHAAGDEQRRQHLALRHPQSLVQVDHYERRFRRQHLQVFALRQVPRRRHTGANSTFLFCVPFLHAETIL